MDCLRKNLDLLTGDMLGDPCSMAGLPSVFSRVWLALCLAERGEFDEALAHGEEALRIAETWDPAFSLFVACAGLGNVHLAKGDFGQAVAVLERAALAEPGEQVGRAWPFVASALGAAHAGVRRFDAALPLLEQAVERATTMKLRANHSMRLARLAEAHSAVGRPESAFPAAAQALDLAQESRERGHEAHVLRLLASIELQREAPVLERVEDGYRRALALAEELGMRPLQAHCHLGLARLSQQRGDPAAAAAMATARDLYRAMKMTFWLNEAQ
jgi:tetratricopeptide (TPR) repeat protein